MVLRLSNDVLAYISDMLQSSLMSYVCQRLFALLQHRHITFSIGGKAAPEQLAHLEALGEAVVSVAIRCRQLDKAGLQAFDVLPTLPSLRSLTLQLFNNALEDSGVCALVAIMQRLPHLHSITLHLGENAIGDAGAEALSTLHTLPRLRCLTLSLWGNQIGDVGACALTTMKEARSLCHLTLDLGSNGVGREGAAALCALKTVPHLRTCSLDLAYNPIRSEGDATLAALTDGRPHQYYSMYLCGSFGWDPDA